MSGRSALEPAARHLRRGWLLRRAVWVVFALVLAAGILLLFVFPGRTLLAQDRSLNQAHHRLQVLNQQNAQLTQRSQQLQSNAEIEQLARAVYGLVLPGEKAYSILPSTPTTTTTPTTTAP
ncbi:MAG: FtsB family cell division protein [Acidimicrobiales bacterium]